MSINKIECVPTHKWYDFPPAEKTMTDFVVIDKTEHTTLVYPWIIWENVLHTKNYTKIFLKEIHILEQINSFYSLVH